MTDQEILKRALEIANSMTPAGAEMEDLKISNHNLRAALRDFEERRNQLSLDIEVLRKSNTELNKKLSESTSRFEKRIKELEAELEDAGKIIAEHRRKADAFDKTVEKATLLSFTSAAKTIGVKPRTLIAWLIEQNYLTRDEHNHLIAVDQNSRLFKKWLYRDEYNRVFAFQTLVTVEGVETFRLMLSDHR